MELTLDQALQKGVEAHKAGELQEADRYYTAILKANPKHPDANHNMGVLAVGVGKVEAALPFFKTALEVKPSMAQFWLSYIDALIKLDQIEDAKAVLEQAKSKGAKGDGFDQIESRLAISAQVKGDQTDEEILGKAFELRESGKYDEAIDLLLHQTKQSPTNPKIPAILSHCYILNDNLEKAIVYLEKAKNINPDIASVGWSETRLLLKQKHKVEALAVAKKTNSSFPNDIEGMGIMGSCLRVNGDYKESLNFLNKAIELDPNYAEALINRGLISFARDDKASALIDLEKAHHLKPHIKQIWDLLIGLIVKTKNYSRAISMLIKMIEIDPKYENNYSLLATCNQEADDPALAIISFEQVLKVRPNDATNCLNLGRAFQRQGKTEKAIKHLKTALSIKPDFVEAHNSMGNALKDQGRLDEAIEAYNKALSIKPDFAEAHNNMGNALQDQGRLDEAIEAYNKALLIKPDFAEVYNNMGNALQDQARLDEAIEAYNKALSIQPNYADVYYNHSGLAENVSEAKAWLEKCLKANPKYPMAKLALSAIMYYEGNESEFNVLIKSPLKDNSYMRSVNWVFGLSQLPPLHFHRWALFNHMITLSKKDRPFYEFGVWRGESFKYFIKTFKTGYGFDTFDGLPEDWHNEKAGTYSSDGNVPKIKGGNFIVGKFEDTLPGFFAEERPMASIINFDADLYSSTICALNYSKPVIDQHTILIFDEFLINTNWEQDEYKALEEFCCNNHFTYEVLAISFFTKQVAVKIIGI